MKSHYLAFHFIDWPNPIIVDQVIEWIKTEGIQFPAHGRIVAWRFQWRDFLGSHYRANYFTAGLLLPNFCYPPLRGLVDLIGPLCL